jgi:Icc-related predicted phosphoesterase
MPSRTLPGGSTTAGFRVKGGCVRIVCISDTHNRTDGLSIPDADVLIHAGDLTDRGTRDHLVHATRWLAGLPHRHKILIAGNHDFIFQQDPATARALTRDVTYLEDSGIEIEGIRFWGSPWQPWFGDWAFTLPRGEKLRDRWALIPDDTDVLITHGPPLGHGDLTSSGERAGCVDSLNAVRRIGPGLHVFGHIHEG